VASALSAAVNAWDDKTGIFSGISGEGVRVYQKEMRVREGKREKLGKMEEQENDTLVDTVLNETLLLFFSIFPLFFLFPFPLVAASDG